MHYPLLIHVIIFCWTVILPHAFHICKQWLRQLCKFVCQSLYVYLDGTYYSDFTQLFSCGFLKTQTCYLQMKICVKNGTLQNNYPKEQFPEKEAAMNVSHYQTEGTAPARRWVVSWEYLCSSLPLQKSPLWVSHLINRSWKCKLHMRFRCLV